MCAPDQLNPLKEMLSSRLIRKRRAGIKMATEMLAQGVCWVAVIDLLEEISANDPITIVQADAHTVLDSVKSQSQAPRPPDYVFPGKCHHGHLNFYDKREWCPNRSSVVRRETTKGGSKVEEILITCKTHGCGEKFFVAVDCAGYK